MDAYELTLWNGPPLLQALLRLERGIIVVQGRRKLEQELIVLIDEKGGAGLSERWVKLIEDMRLQWKELDRRIGEFDAEFAAFAKTNEDARLLLSIPGIGALIASALIAAVGKAETWTLLSTRFWPHADEARAQFGGCVGADFSPGGGLLAALGPRGRQAAAIRCRKTSLLKL